MVFTNEETFLLYILLSFQTTNCQFCSETYSNQISLLDHYAEQHQEETYNCAGCSQLFSTLNEWRAHMCRRPIKGKVVSTVQMHRN